VEVINLF